MMVEWKDTFIHRGKADPERVHAELEAISIRTPENIVKAAQRKSSAMHRCFTWEDSKAAESWRIFEAKSLVNHLVISYSVLTEKDENAEVTVNVYTSVQKEDGRQYVRTSDGINNEVLREMILSEVRSLLDQAKNKMRAHEAFFSAKEMEEVEEILEKIS